MIVTTCIYKFSQRQKINSAAVQLECGLNILRLSYNGCVCLSYPRPSCIFQVHWCVGPVACLRWQRWHGAQGPCAAFQWPLIEYLPVIPSLIDDIIRDGPVWWRCLANSSVCWPLCGCEALGPRSFGLSLTLPRHEEEYAFMCLCVCVYACACVCVHVWIALAGPALLNNEHSFKLGEAD